MNTYYIATFYKICNLLTFTICSLIFKYKLSHLSALQQLVCLYTAGSIILFLLFLFIHNVQSFRYQLCKFSNKSLSSKLLSSKSSLQISHNIKNSKLASSNSSTKNILFQIKEVCFSYNRLLLYFGRSIATALGMLSWLEAMKSLGITESTIISYLTPILTSVLAVLFLKEKIRLNWLISLILGMIGIYFTVQSKNYNIQILGGIFALCSALSWSFYDIICKKQTKQESPFIQVFITFFLSALVILPFSIASWMNMNFIDIAWILMLGILSVISVFSLFMAYTLAPVSHLMPHSYLRLVFAIIAMYIIEKQLPNFSTLIGAAIIIIANLFLFFPINLFSVYNKKANNQYK